MAQIENCWGLILDGEVHYLVHTEEDEPCSTCSAYEYCQSNLCRNYFNFLQSQTQIEFDMADSMKFVYKISKRI